MITEVEVGGVGLDGLPIDALATETCVPKVPYLNSEYIDTIIPGYYSPDNPLLLLSAKLGQVESVEDQKLTNFAYGVIDMKDNEFSSVRPEIGAFKALNRNKDRFSGSITT